MAPLPTRKPNLREACLLADRTVNRNRRGKHTRIVTGIFVIAGRPILQEG
jgi:hypothetical protein